MRHTKEEDPCITEEEPYETRQHRRLRAESVPSTAFSRMCMSTAATEEHCFSHRIQMRFTFLTRIKTSQNFAMWMLCLDQSTSTLQRCVAASGIYVSLSCCHWLWHRGIPIQASAFRWALELFSWWISIGYCHVKDRLHLLHHLYCWGRIFWYHLLGFDM